MTALCVPVPVWTDPARKALCAQTVLAGGFRMALHPADNWTEYKLWSDRRSPEQQSLLRLTALIAGRRALICDIGANCGSYTLALAAAMGAGSVLLAFEPNPVMAARLHTNLALNQLTAAVQFHPCALGAEPGRATLSLHAENFGQSTLRRITADVAGRVEVEVRPLAGFVQQAGPFPVFVIKIDVEGYEDQVLLPFFAQMPPDHWPDAILIEVEHAAQWQTDLCAELTARGYVTSFEDEGNALMLRNRTAAAKGDDDGSINLAQEFENPHRENMAAPGRGECS